MDHLKFFLDSVCKDGHYKYEKVENLAEIYKIDEMFPLALIEWRQDIGLTIRFRIGLSSRDIAYLSRDMTVVCSNLIFDEDFLIDPQYGYLYGEEASKAFIKKIQDRAQYDDTAQEDVIYVSSEPIIAYGSDFPSKTKIEKFWGDDF